MRLKFYATYLVVLLLLCICNNTFGQIHQQAIQQIAKLINEKQSRTPVERKISSQLLQAIRESKGQQMVDGVHLRQANVRTNASGMVSVDINATVSDALLAKIQSAGGKIIFASQKFHSVRVQASLVTAQAIAAYPEIKFIKPAARSHTVGGIGNVLETNGNVSGNFGQPSVSVKHPSFKERAAKVRQQLKKYLMTLGAGSVDSQGDHALGADSTRTKYGYAGQGIKIGVLSDSYNSTGTAAADVASGDLPGPGNPEGDSTAVTVLQDITGGTDEGRAMLQIVHDIAPKAQLFFATADASEAGFAANIETLRNTSNCDIIIDDVIYYDEPPFQDGMVAQAVNDVTAGGALYFSSAGNGGSLLKNQSSVWEGDFNGTGSPQIIMGSKKGQIHNFGTLAAPVFGDSIVTASSVYSLTWADPLGASTNDYDLFIVDKTGTQILASSTDVQDGTGDPIEIFEYDNASPGDQLVVFKDSTAAPVAFSLNTNLDGQGKGIKYSTTGQTHGHSSAVNAFSVAATDASLAYPGLFTASSQVETFSADGPRRVFFNADSTPVTPGNFLFATNGGTVRKKPDITAADGVSTTFAYGGGLNPFYGTSAAAPHAGAVAALLKSAQPSLTPAQIRTLLTSTALDIEAAGYDYNSGYGIVQPLKAMASLNPKLAPTILLGQVSATEGSFSNKNGFIEPGEIGNITVGLIAPLAKAYNVHAILSSTTPGVTITQGSATYGTIALGGDIKNTASPFAFAVNSSVACGTNINFALKVYFDSGGVSPVVFNFSGAVGMAIISSTLGSTPAAGTGYTVVSGQQTGRLSTGTVASSCASPIAADTLVTKTGSRQFDAYTFTNTSNVDECISVTVNSTNGLNIYTAAYNSAGFVPSNPATNFVANPGQSATTMQYSFTAPAGKKYTIVVHDVNVTPASGSLYTLTVSNSNCAVAPACATIKVATTSLAIGTTGTHYSQTIKATGGDGTGDYTFAVTGGLPAGISFNADSLYGKPTQGGTFPLVITAASPTGCSSAGQNDTLTIYGIIPASLKAISGTTQSAIARHAFADSLKAEVFDDGNGPLAGVNVMFIAPSSGATGTFANGSDTAIIVTNSAGIAAAPPFTANTISGSYTVTASVVDIATPVNFNLTNTCVSTVVNTNADAGAGSLRYIVANACPSATVTFAPGISKISLTSGEIDILQPITITGSGANVLTISGSNNSRIFTVDPGTGSNVTISGLAITDGEPSSAETNGGGGILVYSGTVSVNNCVITNNNAEYTYYAEGGGIDNEGGDLTVDHSTIAQNTGYYDGGGLTLGYGTATVTNSTIAGNTIASSGGTAGGGVYCYETFGAANFTNCTIYGNSGQYGGNIYSYNDGTGTSVVTLKNTIAAGGILTGTGGYGPDLGGNTFVSADYNFIQNTGGYSISGTTTNNITGASANLLLLGNYGGTTTTLLPQPNSPVINKGDVSLSASQTDQRGYTRVAAGRADIGAVEANYATTANAGTPQKTVINTAFNTALQAAVTENGNPVSGVNVNFKAPVTTTTATGSFAGSISSVSVATNSGGTALAPTFTANGDNGGYVVADSIGAAFANANFYLTNVITLAVSFGNITATVNNCTVQIAWQTLTGEAGVTFTLEYSTDGNNFAPLYSTTSKGTSVALQTYSYTHATPAVGANYYRVKETDLNNSNIYSETIMAVNTCSNAPVIAYPNPVHNTLTVIMPGTTKQAISIYDARGRLVTRYASAGGTLTIDVSKWAGGIYTLKVAKDDNTTYDLKIIKN